MALSTTCIQCTPKTTKFGKVRQNKNHFAVQGHSRSPIWILVTSSYTTSYYDDSYRQLKYCALSIEFMNLQGLWSVGVARSLCRRLGLLLAILIVNCLWLWLCQPLLCSAPRKLPNSAK